MHLTDDLIARLQNKMIPHAIRGILGHKATMTHEDHHGRLYHGCDYMDEITQSMLLKILIDSGGRFEKAFKKSEKDFINLVMKASRNLTKDWIRNAREVPISQLDTDDDDQSDLEIDDYN